MANEEQLDLLLQGVSAWNAWRTEYPKETIHLQGVNLRETDLTQVDLHGALLTQADLRWAILKGADFRGAVLKRTALRQADLRGANLRGAQCHEAVLTGANLRGAMLKGAAFRRANLIDANLTQADLTKVNLSEALVIRTNLQEATLHHCRIYGISAWDLHLTGAEQTGLIITPDGEPTITVDNLKVAQFIDLLLNHEEIRDVIDTIGRKAVLMLGRFTPKRQAVLDALREALRQYGYTPITFDCQKPTSKSERETMAILARLSRFVLADLTSAKVVLQALDVLVPHLTSVPIQPVLHTRAQQTVVIASEDHRYPWFFPTVHYQNVRDALANLSEKIIAPAEAWIKEQTKSSVCAARLEGGIALS
jgi:uncharacterized protein YjbI with pentapeptide repeats